MPDGRCDLVFLGWTAFVAFNLLSGFLWSSNDGGAGEGSGGPGARPGTTASELYRGEYWLHRNGSTVQTGSVRVTLTSQQTSIRSVQVSTLSFLLAQKGSMKSFGSLSGGLLFSGVELGSKGDRRSMAASSSVGPRSPFGTDPCRLDAVIDLGGPRPVPAGAADAPDWQAAHAMGTEIAGEIAATECGSGLQFRAKVVNVPDFTQKVAHYSIWVNLLTILQIRFYLTQMRFTEDGPSAAKVSVVCIGMQALMDAYDCFLHLSLGLSSRYMFNTLAVVSLFKFVLFMVLEARYLLVIWKQRHLEAFNQGWAAMRREVSWLYSRFYGILVIGLLLIYNFLDHLDCIILAFQAYWIPQIIHDAWQGSRNGLSPVFFLGISATRTLFVLYLWGCPSGIFNGDLYPALPNAPSASLCVVVVALQGGQVLFMLAQRRLGPRWFVPWVCMPWAYNYHRHSRLEPGTDCVICMGELDPEDARRAVTPCNHQFHRACLEQWMDVKMECPTCRATLPPIQ